MTENNQEESVTIGQALDDLEETADDIKAAIMAKGVIPSGGLNSYADAISSISGGGVSSNCFPSGTYETLTLGASGATYTAPADGWYLMGVSAVSGFPIATISLKNLSRGNFGSSTERSNSYESYQTYIPCKSGDNIEILYSTQNSDSSIIYLKFYYTIDSAPQQSQT